MPPFPDSADSSSAQTPPIDLTGLRVRTLAAAKADLPRVQFPNPADPDAMKNFYADTPSAPTSKLGKAYQGAKNWLSEHEQHLSEKTLAPFRESLDRMAEDLGEAGRTGHTKSGGQLTPVTRALLSGTSELLKAVPVGSNLRESAQMAVTPPEFGPEARGLSKELKTWERTGEDLGTLYHGGKVQVGEVDPAKLQQRDAGFYGKGFYLTNNKDYAKTYGKTVSEKRLAPEARVLDVNTIHPQYESNVHPELQKEVEASQRAYVQSLPKAQKNPALVDSYLELIDPNTKTFDLHSWIDAVNRYAEEKGYDAVRFSNGEIVVKKPKSLRVNLEGLRVRPVSEPKPNVAKKINLSGLRVREIPQTTSAKSELPAQPRLPDSSTHAAIKTDDGSIYFDDAPEKQRPTSEENWIRFKASDGRIYVAHPDAWSKVLKRDPGAKKYR